MKSGIYIFSFALTTSSLISAQAFAVLFNLSKNSCSSQVFDAHSPEHAREVTEKASVLHKLMTAPRKAATPRLYEPAKALQECIQKGCPSNPMILEVAERLLRLGLWQESGAIVEAFMRKALKPHERSEEIKALLIYSDAIWNVNPKQALSTISKLLATRASVAVTLKALLLSKRTLQAAIQIPIDQASKDQLQLIYQHLTQLSAVDLLGKERVADVKVLEAWGDVVSAARTAQWQDLATSYKEMGINRIPQGNDQIIFLMRTLMTAEDLDQLADDQKRVQQQIRKVKDSDLHRGLTKSLTRVVGQRTKQLKP